MNNDFNNLEIAGKKLNCDFMKLMPDFLKKELIDVLNKYKSYCDKDAKCINVKYKLYEKNENGVSMIFSVTGFIEAWDLYSDCSGRPVWAKPSEFFKKLESNFLDKYDNFFFEGIDWACEKEFKNKVAEYCENDIMACEKVFNARKEERNKKRNER